MPKRDKIIFDFDGTIADTLDLMLNLYNENCQKYACPKIKTEDLEKIRSFSPQKLLKDYQINSFKLVFLLLSLRRKMKKRIGEVKIYPHLDLVLQELKARGWKLFILTSNSRKNVNIFLEKNNLKNLFSSVYSASGLFTKDKKMRKFFQKEGIDQEECFYVGDELRDIEAMKKVKLPIISVAWGLNLKEALEKANPGRVIEHPRELLVAEKLLT